MSRATYGAARHRKKVRLFRASAGHETARAHRWRLAQHAVVRAGVFAYVSRRLNRRSYRALWVTRLTAACKMRGILYSRFIYGLTAAGIELNRKMLSELAISAPNDFDALVELAKRRQPAAEAAA